MVTRTVEVRIGIQAALDLVASAMANIGVEVAAIDHESATVIGFQGVTRRSWGTQLTVVATLLADDQTRLTCTSQPQYEITPVDWGASGLLLEAFISALDPLIGTRSL